MDQQTGFLAIATIAVTGAIGWLKNSNNNTDKAQRALELHIAEHHMSKEEVKEFVELTNIPIKLQMNTMTTQISSVDTKLDRLLERKK